MVAENKRLVQKGIPKIGLAPEVFVKVHRADEGQLNVGGNCTKYEFMAMLNGGELVSARFSDPNFTVYKNLVGNIYFRYSRKDEIAPVEVESFIKWISDADPPLKTVRQSHSLVTMAPNCKTNASEIEFLAVDTPSYILAGGDAGGYSYEGNISGVVRQVVERYGRGWISLEFDGETIDSKYNKWWQHRMDPKTFILSLLEWSTSLSAHKTRWMLYPDEYMLRIKEQKAVTSLHRATYEWRGYGGAADKRPGDILRWEFIGNNALQMVQHQLVTSGMSAVSGAYFDQSQYRDKKDVVFVGDRQTEEKYKPEVEDAGNIAKSYDRPNPGADPVDDKVIGWSSVPAIPELSAGDMGLKYRDYIDGYARGIYLSTATALMRIRFRVPGHYIWSGSEGLGVDTIDITLTSSLEGAPPYFVAGNWIVYGFHHIYTPGKWVTDLYCYRLDRDAAAKAIGKGA